MTKQLLEVKDTAAEAKREYYREYRKKNKKQIAEYNKKYRQENPEKFKEYDRNYWTRKAEEQKAK